VPHVWPHNPQSTIVAPQSTTHLQSQEILTRNATQAHTAAQQRSSRIQQQQSQRVREETSQPSAHAPVRDDGDTPQVAPLWTYSGPRRGAVDDHPARSEPPGHGFRSTGAAGSTNSWRNIHGRVSAPDILSPSFCGCTPDVERDIRRRTHDTAVVLYTGLHITVVTWPGAPKFMLPRREAFSGTPLSQSR
jgi:hypothetical protein